MSAAYVHPRLRPTDSPSAYPCPAASPTEQSQRVLDALAAGQISPDQATRTLQSIALHRRILEIDDLAARVKRLEQPASG